MTCARIAFIIFNKTADEQNLLHVETSNDELANRQHNTQALLLEFLTHMVHVPSTLVRIYIVVLVVLKDDNVDLILRVDAVGRCART